jgi:manganese/zinc/iron transport system permease protein
MLTIFSDYTLRTVALGAGALGIVSGVLGSFAVLRKQSLLGDAISHAALPGVVIGFLIGGKSPLALLIGAAGAGWLGTVFVRSIVRNTRIKDDGALGLVLSVFFGIGLMLLTFVQRTPDASQAGLDTFLFGQAAALVRRDVVTMALLGAVAVVTVAIFWKEFKLLSFDREFGTTLGLPMERIDALLTTLLVVAIVIGLQTVGVVLMSAMVVAPGAAARQWTNRLGIMVPLSALFGAAAGVSGALISSAEAQLPTGPMIVLSASVVVLISLLFAPGRGLLWELWRRRRNRKRLRVDTVLADLYALDLQHEEDHAHHVAVLNAMSAEAGGVVEELKHLESRGWARETGDEQWLLTDEGRAEARLRSSREGTARDGTDPSAQGRDGKRGSTP